MLVLELCVCSKVGHLYGENEQDIPVGEFTVKLIEAEWRRYASVNLSSLVQIMACRLVGAKPLSEPMLEYY